MRSWVCGVHRGSYQLVRRSQRSRRARRLAASGGRARASRCAASASSPSPPGAAASCADAEERWWAPEGERVLRAGKASRRTATAADCCRMKQLTRSKSSSRILLKAASGPAHDCGRRVGRAGTRLGSGTAPRQLWDVTVGATSPDGRDEPCARRSGRGLVPQQSWSSASAAAQMRALETFRNRHGTLIPPLCAAASWIVKGGPEAASSSSQRRRAHRMSWRAKASSSAHGTIIVHGCSWPARAAITTGGGTAVRDPVPDSVVVTPVSVSRIALMRRGGGRWRLVWDVVDRTDVP